MSSGLAPQPNTPPEPQADDDYVAYRTYDDRLVSARVIERVLRDLDARERRAELWSRARVWAGMALICAVVIVVTVAVVWWRLITPM